MRLVVDANIVVSAILSRAGKTRELLFLKHLELHAPPFLIEELESHGPELKGKSALREMDYSIALARIFSCIRFVPPSDYIASVALAASVSPDIGDADYLALALHLRCPLRSNDKRLKKQARVRVLSTHELARLLEVAHPHE